MKRARVLCAFCFILPVLVALPAPAEATARSAAAPRQADVPSAPAKDPNLFFGVEAPAAGTVMSNVMIVAGKLVAKTITVTSSATGNLAGSAELVTGRGGTVHATWTWQNRCYWQMYIEANSASGPPVPGAPINFNQVTGSIRNSGCSRQIDLTAHGYSVGQSSVDLALTLVKGGMIGTAQVQNLVLGQIQYKNIKLTVSTLNGQKGARLEGLMVSDLGTFTVDANVTRSAAGYSQSLAVTGADLALESASFKFTSFSFKTSSTFPADGCPSFSASIAGELEMKSSTFTLNNGTIAINCGKVTTFAFKITISHEDAAGYTSTGVLAFALTSTPGTADDLTSSSLGEVDGKVGTIKYAKGLFASVDLSKSRSFSEKFKDWLGKKKCFCVDITIGLVFGVAIYTPQSNPTGPYSTMIGAGGYFDAGRVRGSVGCLYTYTTSSDFTCAGKFTVDPSWAGKYTRSFSGL